MSKSQRDKGLRAEREIVDRHKAINVHAERIPLSGASRYRGAGHDVDLYPFGRDAAPLVAEVKARGNGSGFTLLEKWLGERSSRPARRPSLEHLGDAARKGASLTATISPGRARVVGFS